MPRWRDVQPLLIRSAGVVGIAATIIAVVTSDAFRSEEGSGVQPSINAVAEQAAAPTIVAASEIRAGGETGSGSRPVASDIAPQNVASAESSIFVVTPVVGSPTATGLNGMQAVPLTSPNHPPVPVPADISSEPAASSTRAAGGAEEISLDELRRAPVPPEGRNGEAPTMTASVPAISEIKVADEPQVSPAIPIADLRVADDASGAGVVAATSAPDAAVAPTDGGCTRAWLVHPADSNALACQTTLAMIAPAEDAPAALVAAAQERALALAALPRIPLARPEPPADFNPTKARRVQRVSGHRADWPDEPPPACGAGKHAKWRFVDRAADRKEWYCR